MITLENTFTGTIAVNKIQAEHFLENLDGFIEAERVLLNNVEQEDNSTSIQLLKEIKEQAIKLLKL